MTNLNLLKTIKPITLTALKDNPVMVYPALIVSIKTERGCSLISLLNGESVRVKEKPEHISAKITSDYRNLSRKAMAYSHFVECMEQEEDPFKDDELERYFRVAALKKMSEGLKRSGFGRLMNIYRTILSPFTFFSSFSSGDGEISNYRKDMEEIIGEEKIRKSEHGKDKGTDSK